jgi:lipoprotein-releasing system ATP-binding protein
MSEGDPILELRGVTKSYETGAPEPTRVLMGVDLAVRRGETLAILGPSGSGKSTLLNILGTLDRPTSGEVRLDGEDVSRMNDAALARLRNRKLGFVFQMHHLLPQCSILENVLVPTVVSDGDAAAAADRARSLLERVGLTHRLEHRPGQLSGGERQRVAVVRALINEPALLLADEPTGSLDRSGSENLCRLLTELNAERGVTILMVTHSMRSARTMKRALELRDGVLAEPASGLSGE